MPTSRLGQLITFAIDTGGDQKFQGTTRVRTTKHMRTCKKVAANRGHPNLAPKIAQMNGIRNPRAKLKIGRSLRVPDKLRQKYSFHVLAGDSAPTVMRGYAKISVLDRSERRGMSVFTGYDPVVLSVPVRFEAIEQNDTGPYTATDGTTVERSIAELERMAGRGNFQGSARGPSSIVRVSTTDDNGTPIPLIPFNYQWKRGNPTAPTYWISNIDWDENPVRNHRGQRIRQLATIELTEYVRPRTIAVSTRHRMRRPN